ncbi:MAG: transporter associated domain-containing protein [Steroidobacteraceae bacterium]
MSKDGNTTGRWLRRITQSLAGETQDREALVGHMLEARENGLIDSDAMAMLQGVLDVADLQVRDIMVPRTQMAVVRREEPAPDILARVIESGHSRFPVMDDDRDDIVGILLAKDLLRLCAAGEQERFNIREFMRPAVFVPESKRLNMLLKEFRGNRNHMAIVVDEYGGVSGLVTIEDVIEQIVGDIDDEFDIEEDDANIRMEAEHQYAVRGVTRLEEFNEYFGTQLQDEDFDTVAGLVMKTLGRLPRRGESVTLADLELRVVRVERRRVDLLRVTCPRDLAKPPAPAAD